ncbi:MAG: lipid A deacylase LpxR family protein, partial [Wenzhouxiangella sp.]
QKSIALRDAVLALLALAFLSAGACAAEEEAEPTLWLIEYENDLVAGQDRYYTSGIRFQRIAEARSAPDWLASVARRFPGFSEANALPYAFSVNHNIFTPADIENPEFPPDDRPYAAWLNVSFATGTLQPRGADRVRVGLGVVGPAALGEQIQKGVHDVMDAPEPVGWDTQLRNEPTLLLGYDRIRRLLDGRREDRVGVDLTGFGGVTLGNAYTNVAGGLFARIGYNLANDYGPPRITPAVSGSGYFQPGQDRSWYFFVGTEARAVGRDLFIEGNTFGGRDGVEVRRWVNELFAGFQYSHDRFRLAYTHVWRSREFEGQISGQDYGSIAISLWW